MSNKGIGRVYQTLDNILVKLIQRVKDELVAIEIVVADEEMEGNGRPLKKRRVYAKKMD